MKILSFFLFLWVIFALMDLDSGLQISGIYGITTLSIMGIHSEIRLTAPASLYCLATSGTPSYPPVSWFFTWIENRNGEASYIRVGKNPVFFF
jgi:hypothetical protein